MPSFVKISIDSNVFLKKTREDIERFKCVLSKRDDTMYPLYQVIVKISSNTNTLIVK